MEYAAVVEALLSGGESRMARVRQVTIEDVGGWSILSGRCHIRAGEGFSEPRLGFWVESNLRPPYQMIMTRFGDRVTICEVEADRIQDGSGPSVDVPMRRAGLLRDLWNRWKSIITPRRESRMIAEIIRWRAVCQRRRCMEYAAVVEALLSGGESRMARVRQVTIEDVGGWSILSGRCHIRAGEGFSEPRLGFWVESNLRPPYQMIMTRFGDRVTICEVEADRIQDGSGPSVDVPMRKQVTLHQTIMSALEGKL